MARILVLWNQIDDDVYEHYRRDGLRSPEWDPSLVIEPWKTYEEEMQGITRALEAAGHEATLVNIRDSFHEIVRRPG